MSHLLNLPNQDAHSIAAAIRALGLELGFASVGVTGIDLENEAAGYQRWLQDNFHGDMKYMSEHGSKRWRPAELQPGTRSVISVTLNYSPASAAPAEQILQAPEQAYVSRYALGRDYHKVLRNKLQAFADAIHQKIKPHSFRVFTDSAPVMEIPLAVNAGLGWRGKHTLLLNRDQGSMFFIGEIYSSLELEAEVDRQEKQENHCGSCRACIEACPTQAIVAEGRVDARRCISYLTIEHHGAIPLELRPLMGNRIYGCDDCQLFCPWNKFAAQSNLPDFEPRNGLDAAALVDLFAWTEPEFDKRLEGNPIRRIGHTRWLRNIAVALGNACNVNNAPSSPEILAVLKARMNHSDEMVREHVAWALSRHSASETRSA